MPSILNTPANKIPIHFFHLPIAQREILLVNVLTDPILYDQIITSALYNDNLVFPQAITLFQNYVLIQQLFAHLTIPHLPIQITEAFDPALSSARTTVLVLLVDQGLDRLLGTLPRDHLTNILHTILLSLSEEQHQAYYGSYQVVEEVLEQPEGRLPHLELPIPTPLDPLCIPFPPTLYLLQTPPSIPYPSWLDKPTASLDTLGLPLPFPLENDIIATLLQLNKVGEGLVNEVLLE